MEPFGRGIPAVLRRHAKGHSHALPGEVHLGGRRFLLLRRLPDEAGVGVCAEARERFLSETLSLDPRQSYYYVEAADGPSYSCDPLVMPMGSRLESGPSTLKYRLDLVDDCADELPQAASAKPQRLRGLQGLARPGRDVVYCVDAPTPANCWVSRLQPKRLVSSNLPRDSETVAAHTTTRRTEVPRALNRRAARYRLRRGVGRTSPLTSAPRVASNERQGIDGRTRPALMYSRATL